MIGGTALDRHSDDLFGFLFAFFFGLAFDIPNQHRGFDADLFFNIRQQQLLGFFDREARDTLKFSDLFFYETVEIFFFTAEFLFPAAEIVFPFLDIL
jgi:hypothetical protein